MLFSSSKLTPFAHVFQSLQSGGDRCGSAVAGRSRLDRKRRLAVEVMEERICLTSTTVTVSGSSPTVIPLPGVRAGDTINLEITLNTDDPNENGEGEPLTINSSGVFSLTQSAYAQTLATSFMATMDDESLTASIPGGDGDETGTITIDTNQKKRFSQDTKDKFTYAAADLNIGAGFTATVGAACLLAPDPSVSKLCALIAGGLSGVSWTLSAIFQRLALDPPDPNFTVIAQPAPPSLQPIPTGPGVDQAAADALNNLILNEEQAIGLGRAIITSVNRADGSAAVNDTIHEAAQMNAAYQYAGQVATLVDAEPGLRTKAADALKASGFSVGAVMEQDALNFERSVATNGLPSFVTTTLQQLGVDDLTLANIKELAIVQDTKAVAGDFFAKLNDSKLASDLHGTAQGLMVFGGPTAGVHMQFSAAAYQIAGDAGSVTITVTRDNASGPVSVDYATSGGSAIPGTDYVATSGTLSFADGENSKTFTVGVLNNPDAHADRTVNLTLSNPTLGATLGSLGSATLTISALPIMPQPTDGPRVMIVQRFGIHRQPTRLVLTFDSPLDPGRAQDNGNYTVLASGQDGRLGTRDDLVIHVHAAAYNPMAHAVTIIPNRRLNLYRRYLFLVSGIGPRGMADPSGRLLDGADTGQPGSNFLTKIGPEISPGPGHWRSRQLLSRKAGWTVYKLHSTASKRGNISPEAVDVLAGRGVLEPIPVGSISPCFPASNPPTGIGSNAKPIAANSRAPQAKVMM
jgi:hypothetical protein